MKKIDCEHWSDCGVTHGGCCKLGSYGGRPSLGTCKLVCRLGTVPSPPPQKFPPLAKEAKTLAGAVGRAAKALATGKKVLAAVEIRKERIAICENCEYFAKEHTRCYKCGCGLLAKVALATESCPEGKWPQTSEVQEWQELLP